MVRIHPDPPLRESARVQGWAVRWKGGPDGAVAQLGERLLCKQEVVGSIPSGSTKHHLSLAVAKQRSTLVPRAEGPASRAASFFNNLEGKASMGPMRACGR